MLWEALTSDDFQQAVQDHGVCVVPMGVLERHSAHLPLGTDVLNAGAIARDAAEKEPAIVFPTLFYGQIYEARCFPGTITLPPTLLLELLRATLDDIGRNGIQKIILSSFHGGNNILLRFLSQCELWEEKPYALYVYEWGRTEEEKAVLETTVGGHACEWETSVSLANFPEYVHMERVPEEPALPLGRYNIPNSFSGFGWYGNYPEHYAGDARTASVEKGRKLKAIQVDALASFIAAVKADRSLPGLRNDFFNRTSRV